MGPKAVYVASNAWWEELYVRLPELPPSACWYLAADTWEERVAGGPVPTSGGFIIRPRSVMVFVGR